MNTTGSKKTPMRDGLESKIVYCKNFVPETTKI